MILTVTGMSKSVMSALCVFEEHDELLFYHHIQIHVYICTSAFRKFFSEILITIHVYNKSERISGVVLEYVVLTFICIVSVVE